MFDLLAQRYFPDSDTFFDALKILQRFKVVESGDNVEWDAIQGFYDSLTEFEEALLDGAIEYEKHSLKSADASSQRIADLERQLSNYTHLVGLARNGRSEPVVRPDYTPEEDPTIEVLAEKFLEKKKSGTAQSTIKNYGQRLQTITFMLRGLNGGVAPTCSQVSNDMIRKLADILPRIPRQKASMTQFKKMSGLKFVAFLCDTTRQELLEQRIEPIRSKTILLYVNLIKQFFKDTVQGQYPLKPELSDILDTIVCPKNDQLKRVHFSNDDLRRIFESRQYKLAEHDNDVDYWAPLIALFSGATQSEIVQLYTDDIRQEDGIPVIDVNDDGDKQLKNNDGRPRLVPIHNLLIKLGFLEFVEHQKSKGHLKLFPQEQRDKHTGGYSAYSKRFNNFKRRLGIEVPDGVLKDFHSFRHMVVDQMVGGGGDEGVVNDIVGHKSAIRSESRRNYSRSGAWVKTRNELIQSIHYNVNFEYPKRWVPK